MENENPEIKKSEKTDAVPSLNILNDDCLILIFQHLPIIDKIKIERVCKRWQELSKESWYMFKKLDLFPATWGWSLDSDKKFISNEIMQAVLMRCSQYLTDIDLSRKSLRLILYYVSIEDVCKQCQKLETLNISDLSTNRQKFSSSFSDSRRLISSLMLLNCENLVKLGFEPWDSKIDERVLITLFHRMKKLKVLRLGSFGRTLYLRGECFLYLPSNTIEEIILVGCFFTLTRLFCKIRKAFDAFTKLQTLVLFQCAFVDDVSMRSFPSNLVTLKSLAISGVSSVTQEGLNALCKLENLEQFCCDGVVLTTNILREICNNCNLTFLSLSDCECLHNSELTSCLELLPNLRHLALSRLRLTDLNLRKINTLKYLELSRCPVLENDGLCQLIQHNSILEILSLERCLRVTNILLQAAEKATKNRENNVALYLSTFKTGIVINNFQNTSPLLKIFKSIKRVRGTNSFTDNFFPDRRNFEFVEF